MTKQEWLIHILNGGKGTSNYTDEGEYIEFKDDEFYYNDGHIADLHFHTENFAKYFEYPIYAKRNPKSGYLIICKFYTSYCKGVVIESDYELAPIGFIINDNVDSISWEILPDYEEVIKKPKKMVKVAPYLYEYSKDDCYVQTSSYYKDDTAFLKVFYNYNTKFKRLTALEIEVEDYERD